jgi:carboxylesterase
MKPDAGPFRLGAVGRDAPAVLCLHGLTGTPYEVRPPAEALAARGFACAGPELPGHGSSPGELARTSRSDWLHAVAAAFDELASTSGSTCSASRWEACSRSSSRRGARWRGSS